MLAETLQQLWPITAGRDLNYSYNFEMFSDLFYEENPSGSILTRGHLQ